MEPTKRHLAPNIFLALFLLAYNSAVPAVCMHFLQIDEGSLNAELKQLRENLLEAGKLAERDDSSFDVCAMCQAFQREAARVMTAGEVKETGVMIAEHYLGDSKGLFGPGADVRTGILSLSPPSSYSFVTALRYGTDGLQAQVGELAYNTMENSLKLIRDSGEILTCDEVLGGQYEEFREAIGLEAWDASRQYKAGDQVIVGGKDVYMANGSTSGTDPTASPEFWEKSDGTAISVDAATAPPVTGAAMMRASSVHIKL